jgi:D-3-phosphoglycerate dehydrogenase / 2-oxoglutarate reductase
MSEPRILVTCPPMLGLFDEFAPTFTHYALNGHPANVAQVMTEDELIAILPEYDGWIIGDDPASRRVFEAARAGKLRAAVKWGVGVDNVDFEACRDLGIPVSNTPGVFGREVADIAMCYVLGLARKTFEIDRAIRQNHSWPKPAGSSTWGKTVALVGFGDIGRMTARRLEACDMKVIAYDPHFTPAESMEVESATWPDRIDEADFIVFTCPMTSETKHMFNEALLSKIKPGVHVINVSRGPVIKQSALVQGLENGIVGSAALDVFEVEPLEPDNPLRRFDNTIFGSHNGSNTVDAVRNVSRLAIQRMAEFLSAA